jgi:hypothetical protein
MPRGRPRKTPISPEPTTNNVSKFKESRGRPKKIVSVSEVELLIRNNIKFTRTYEDEYTIEVWTFDLEVFKLGPISVDIKYKPNPKQTRNGKNNKNT